MSPIHHRKLEVEVLEDRCTPSVGPSFFPAPVAALPNGVPTSQAPTLVQPNGSLTVARYFNFAAPSFLNQAEIPLPSNNLILQSNQLNTESPGTFATEISPWGFNVNNSPTLETNVFGTPEQATILMANLGQFSLPGLTEMDIAANLGRDETILFRPAVTDLGMGPSQLGSPTAPQVLLSVLAGIPLTVPFPLPSYYEALPLYDTGDTAIAEPSSVEFESFSPFTTGGMVRGSYEGGNGPGLFAAQVKPPAVPPPVTPVTFLYMNVEWYTDL
jgi:hypothetical protein